MPSLQWEGNKAPHDHHKLGKIDKYCNRMCPAETWDRVGIADLNLGSKRVHFGDDPSTKRGRKYREPGSPCCEDRPPRDCITRYRCSSRNHRNHVVGVEEAADKTRVKRSVVLEHQQRYRAQEEVGCSNEKRHREEQGSEHGCRHFRAREEWELGVGGGERGN